MRLWLICLILTQQVCSVALVEMMEAFRDAKKLKKTKVTINTRLKEAAGNDKFWKQFIQLDKNIQETAFRIFHTYLLRELNHSVIDRNSLVGTK